MKNFIDRALANKDNMSNDDFLQAMADIYEEPEVRALLNQYPQYVRDVINIIDYDTELQMEGLTSCLSEMYDYNRFYCALINCGAVEEAHILTQAKQLDRDNEDYDEQIAKLEGQTALYNDYDAFWDLVRDYIGKNG